MAHATRRLTLKQAANGNLIVGGGWKAAWDPLAGRTRPTLQGVSGNLAVVLRMLPGLGALQVIRSWTGVAFVTPPAIGASPCLPGLYHAVVQNGMTLGPAIGRAGAALVLGRAPEHDLSAFSRASAEVRASPRGPDCTVPRPSWWPLPAMQCKVAGR